VGIHRLLHSSCCFLNTNTAITRQLVRKARTLEAEWWQVCGEAWVRGQRKMSQVLAEFGLLDFTLLRPILSWRAFWNLRIVYFFNFPNIFSGRGEPRIIETADMESAYICNLQVCIRNSFHELKQRICIILNDSSNHTQIFSYTHCRFLWNNLLRATALSVGLMKSSTESMPHEKKITTYLWDII